MPACNTSRRNDRAVPNHRHLVRLVITFALLLACLPLAPASAALPQTAQDVVPFGVHGGFEYVDMVKQSPRFDKVSGDAPDLTLDEAGWPQGDFQFIFADERRNMPWDGIDFNGVQRDLAGTYKMSFTGQATITTEGFEDAASVLIQNQVYDAATNTTTADVVVQPNHWLLGIKFRETRRQPADNPGTGVTNLRLIRPGYPADTTQWLTTRSLMAYKLLGPRFFRSFDNGINSYGIWNGDQLVDINWADRSLPSDAYWPLPSKNAGNKRGLGTPWEYYITLCNEIDADLWVNLPVGATDDYVIQLAKLLKDGNEFTRGLKPGLNIYVEYSNEVWNWGFSQATYNSVKAQQEGLSDGVSSKELKRYVERTIEISNLFKQVYGADALNTTVRPLAVWQYNNWLPMQDALLWAEAKFGAPVKQFIYGIGEAPYLDPQDRSSVDSILDTMWTSSDAARIRYLSWQTVATFFGLKQVGYESGPSLNTGIEADANRDPRISAIIRHHYMDNFFAVGGEAVAFFAMGPGYPSPWGDWFLFEDYAQILHPKMVGALQVSRQPRPPITVGHVLPWTPGQSITLDASQTTPAAWASQADPGSSLWLCPNGCWPYGAYADYLLRASGGGTFEVTLSGHLTNSGDQVQVQVDSGEPVNVTLPLNTDGSATPVSFKLTEGFHTLMLRLVGSGQAAFAAGGGIKISLVKGDDGQAIRPAAPMNLRASVADGKVNLRWAPASTAESYTIKRSTQSGGPYEQAGTATTCQFSDTTAANGTRYYYVVTASNAGGESANSPQIAVVPAPGKPAKPAGVTISAGGGSPGFTWLMPGGEARLSWPAVPNAESYNVKRSQSATGPFTTVQSQISTEYTDLSTQLNQTYYYVVSAVNALGESADSDPVSATPALTAPDAPTNLTAVAGDGRVSLQWKESPWLLPGWGPLFHVKRSESAAGPFTTIVNLATNNMVDVGLTNGKTYYYVVSAINGAGESVDSAPVSATPAEGLGGAKNKPTLPAGIEVPSNIDWSAFQ